MTVRELNPQVVWNHFADLNAVPRPSKNEAQVIEFIKSFGLKLNLETRVDDIGNVIIRKPATPGMEDRTPVVMQAHLDMVHQKNNDTQFDFDKEGIQMYVDGDWVRAKGTTLGADNGLGVAAIMAVLSSDTVAHPELEALFTIDEETGMTGAKGLSPNTLNGKILLNLDTEEDDEIGIGCAGGVDITARQSYETIQVEKGLLSFNIEIKGLQGGHSGMDIIKGLGNANKFMNRILMHLATHIEIAHIDGGGLRNAIPRESKAIVGLSAKDKDVVLNRFEEISNAIQDEYASLEPQLSIVITESKEEINEVLSPSFKFNLLKAIQAAHNGVYRMSPDIENLVETSNNLARVTVKDGVAELLCLTRSSVASSRENLAQSLQSVFELAGFKVILSGEYPGWQPNVDSPILKVLEDKYKKLFSEEPHIAACHAGLECGIIGNHYPEMDMISFGPTIRGAHSPDERASITSTQKFWSFLQEILKDIPKK